MKGTPYQRNWDCTILSGFSIFAAASYNFKVQAEELVVVHTTTERPFPFQAPLYIRFPAARAS
jgi:hypothetical protein